MTNSMHNSDQARNALKSCCENRDGSTTSGKRSGSFGGLLLLALLCNISVMTELAVAEDKEELGTEVAIADISNQDLLLFWEEKELYVQTATRTAKPISQVAENMVVVTAKDILDMNAHNVYEVLNRVSGLYVDSSMDFGSTSMMHIQGSQGSTTFEDIHVSVLLDGVPWNFLSGGNAETTSIPVQIIDRIEIVKGPASSAWGSSLGGVINIITKNAGDGKLPNGTLGASYGEADSQDYHAQLAGKAGAVGYYLFTGRQRSDGLRDHRSYSRDSLYGKFSVAPRHDLDLVFTAGYSDPFLNGGDNPSPARISDSILKLTTLFVTGSFDYRINPELSLKGTAFTYHQKFDASSRLVATFPAPQYAGTFFRGSIFDEETEGGSLKLVYAGDIHTAVLGLDLSFGTMDGTINYGPFVLANYNNLAAQTLMRPSVNKVGFFVNDTVALDKFSITPGLRLDRNSVSGNFVSPSLGATYEFSEHIIARASVARGFASPPFAFTAGSGYFLNPSPNLKEQSVMSYQAGVESAVIDYLNVKCTLFRHDSKDELVILRIPTQRGFKVASNAGKVVRQGYELDVETAPVYNVSFKAAHAYVHIDADSRTDTTVNYSYQLGIKYDDRESIVVQLFGNYISWDIDPALGVEPDYDNFIWDASVTKKFSISAKTTVDAFLTVHNVFDAGYYTFSFLPNPGRWIDGGLRFNF